ncbi:ATP-dependent DNA ligase [Nocardia sp. NPDC023852]|uniref:ATP-dependent DNA ligase n=1 Tax=Nocardia sp. NPDC023852 TaxID=3154697 RepID=UPI0033C7CD51
MARVPAPMLATAGPVPADDDLRYAYEFKYDGIRCLARVSSDTCHLITRNGNTITHSFPEIAQALIELAAGRVLILDSEIVTPDRGGVPRFGLMSRRLGVMRPSATLLRSVPAQMYAFDLLGVDGHDLRDLPYLDRREHLAGLGLPHGPIRISPYYLDVPVSRMLEVAAEHDLEGVVAKRVDGSYRSGRSTAWLKLPLRRTTEVVIVGWLPTRANPLFGSLLIAAHDTDNRLILLGGVGTGFTNTARRALHRELIGLSTPAPPVAGSVPASLAGAARWVSPRLVGEVTYRERTASSLRHPSWRGLRPDREIYEVKLPGR